ncbi:ABC transporter permease [Phytohabitans sp. ZYX-F-186]|uniref:ABC transporter permease n=1 Tax=Phytohabitans maris TaxID=3071409 RepID=A0ABU0ZRU6_9ACTN|nr:ABC transporter permease [Phytohabitans sp. ZYX-F-186]MDQ7908677.1 ABC transporter permease [Phytohabitans sp. ZYX-F-186]
MSSLVLDGAAARRRRIASVLRRDFFALRRDPPRMVDMAFWPTTELVLWGLVSMYMQQNRVHIAVAMLLGAVLLWQVMHRSQGELAFGFLFDVWSRNLLNVFVSPLSTLEYVAGLVLASVVKVTATIGVMATLAFVFYGFGLLTIGPGLVPFMAVLMVMGWALGVVAIAAVIRFGQSAQIVAFILVFVFQPFAAVFYPLSVLPGPAQAVAALVPASHVFEGMRAVLTGGGVGWGGLAVAALLDVAYVAGALAFLLYALRYARLKGKLSRFGS